MYHLGMAKVTGTGGGRVTGVVGKSSLSDLASKLAGKKPSVLSGGRVKERPGVGTSRDALERRSDAQYRELLGAAARKGVEVQRAMRERTYKPRMTSEAEDLELKAWSRAKDLGYSRSDFDNDLRSMMNLRY